MVFPNVSYAWEGRTVKRERAISESRSDPLTCQQIQHLSRQAFSPNLPTHYAAALSGDDKMHVRTFFMALSRSSTPFSGDNLPK